MGLLRVVLRFSSGGKARPQGGEGLPRGGNRFPRPSHGLLPGFQRLGSRGQPVAGLGKPVAQRVSGLGTQGASRRPTCFGARDARGERLPHVFFGWADLFSESGCLGRCLGSLSPALGSRMQAVEPTIPAEKPSIHRVTLDAPRIGN